jgi:hypothetical protein
MLASLAREGRTVILTIHQPGSDLFQRFDNILILARGGFPVFSGKGVDMLPYFSSIGFQCSEHTNPADFALDLVTVNLQATDKEAISREKVEGLVTEWRQRESSSAPAVSSLAISMPAELGSFKRAMTPFWVAFPLLIKRSLLNFRRDTTVATARISQVLGYGVIVSLFFAPIKKDYDSIQSRFGFIQEVVGKFGVQIFEIFVDHFQRSISSACFKTSLSILPRRRFVNHLHVMFFTDLSRSSITNTKIVRIRCLPSFSRTHF